MSAAERRITAADLLPLPEYVKVRKERRQAVVGMKKLRRLEVGPVATFMFESFETMWLQIQEMLYIEKGGAAQVEDELAAYNPLIPQGGELVATVMFEIDDPLRRQAILAQLELHHGGQSRAEHARAVLQQDADDAPQRAADREVDLALTDHLVVSEVYPIALADIGPNSFIGTAALPQPDGTLRAIAVTVFPESSRGVGEGHRPFDLQPQSTMTNATVADVAAAPVGRRLQLKYKDGEKTLVVPPEAPVVTFRPADRSLLVPGASVSLSAQEIAGRPTALRVNAGRNGFVLPY